MGDKKYFLVNFNNPQDVLYKIMLAVERANGKEPAEWKHEKVLTAYMAIIEIMMPREEVAKTDGISNIRKLVNEKIVNIVADINKNTGHDWKKIIGTEMDEGEEIKVIDKEVLEEAMQEMIRERTQQHDSQN